MIVESRFYCSKRILFSESNTENSNFISQLSNLLRLITVCDVLNTDTAW